MPQPSTLGQRLDRALTQAQLAAQGPAIDYDREVVTKTPTMSSAPPDVDLTGEVMADAALRTVVLLEAAEICPATGELRVSTSARTPLRRVIRRYEGYPAAHVALFEWTTPHDVRATRAALRLDPERGTPLEKALTASPAAQLDAYQDQMAPDYEWSFEPWEQISTPEAVYGLEWDHEDEPPAGKWTPTEDRGVSRRRYYEDYASPASAKDATYPKTAPPFDGDPAGAWLQENDPRKCAEGVASEAAVALSAVGLTLHQASEAFPRSGGRPSAALRELRDQVRDALAPMYADDLRRDFMAEALGIHPATLWRLMKTATQLI